MENILRRIFISVVKPPNFIPFRLELGLKIALQCFTSLRWHLRTALKILNASMLGIALHPVARTINLEVNLGLIYRLFLTVS